jgi:hypothetical protein
MAASNGKFNAESRPRVAREAAQFDGGRNKRRAGALYERGDAPPTGASP